MIMTESVIVLSLLLLNAFFALSEMAIVSASRPLLRQMAKQGNRQAAAALALAEDSGKFLSTVQVGITLVGILAGTYGGAKIAHKLEPHLNAIGFIAPHGDFVALVLVVAGITYCSVVVGELIPKQLALSKPEAFALWVARPMTLLSIACTPVVKALELSAGLFFRLFRIRREAERVTEAEVSAIVAEGAASGAIEKSEHDMFQRILRFGDRDVKSIMTPRVDVTFIDVSDNTETIRQKVHAAQHSRFPVIDGDTTRVVGVVLAKELLDAILTHPGQLHVQDHIKPVPTLVETTKCLTALELFKTSSVHIAVVIDEHGSGEGIVTASDILEAIVGVMPSNYDEDRDPLIVTRNDGSWLVDGATPIHELHLAIGLTEIDVNAGYETIAGFLLHRLERTPAVGEVIEQHGYRFEVVDLDGHRIDKILISKLEDGATNEAVGDRPEME